MASNHNQSNETLKNRELSPDSPVLKTLGLWWDTSGDTWLVNKPDFRVKEPTKRSLLSDLAKVFDPLGLFSILSIQGKLILQEVYEGVWKWDGVLPSKIQGSWSELISRFELSLSIPVPRWLGTNLNSNEPISLHCFTDASDKAIGCVIYLVQGKTRSFYTAKTKVVPIKQNHFSVPRKELTALALGIRLIKFVMKSIQKYLKPNSVHLWSDSTTALNWSVTKTNIKELFIRARVEHLQPIVQQLDIKLHYIVSEFNPADYLTKPSEVGPHHPLWTQGPDILNHPERWIEFTKAIGSKDTIPVFQGALTTQPTNQDSAEEHQYEVSNYKNISQLYKETAQRKFNDSSSLRRA